MTASTTWSHSFALKVVAHTGAEGFLLQTWFQLQPGTFSHHCFLLFVLCSFWLPVFLTDLFTCFPSGHLILPPSVLSAALLFFIKVPGALSPPLPSSFCPPAPLTGTIPGKQKSACQALPALSHSLPNTYCCQPDGKVAPVLFSTP